QRVDQVAVAGGAGRVQLDRVLLQAGPAGDDDRDAIRAGRLAGGGEGVVVTGDARHVGVPRRVDEAAVRGRAPDGTALPVRGVVRDRVGVAFVGVVVEPFRPCLLLPCRRLLRHLLLCHVCHSHDSRCAWLLRGVAQPRHWELEGQKVSTALATAPLLVASMASPIRSTGKCRTISCTGKRPAACRRSSSGTKTCGAAPPPMMPVIVRPFRTLRQPSLISSLGPTPITPQWPSGARDSTAVRRTSARPVVSRT